MTIQDPIGNTKPHLSESTLCTNGGVAGHTVISALLECNGDEIEAEAVVRSKEARLDLNYGFLQNSEKSAYLLVYTQRWLGNRRCQERAKKRFSFRLQIGTNTG